MLLVPLLILGACADRDRLPSTVFRDSAGIVVVENGSSAVVAVGPAIVPSSSRIVAVEDDGAVQGVTILGSQQVVYASGQTKSLMWIDSAGGVIRRAGRAGDGPGEFHGFGGLFRCHGDSIVVVSPPARLTTIDALGNLITTEDLPLLRRGGYGVIRDCSHVLVLEVPRDVGVEGDPNRSATLSWQSRATGATTPIAPVQSYRRASIDFEGVRLPLPVPFSAASVWAVGGQCTYVGSATEPAINVYDQHGHLVRILRWDATPDVVTEEDRVQYGRDRAEALALFGPAARATLPPLSAFPTVTEKPFYRRLLVDDSGYLWVEQYPSRWEGFERLLGPASLGENRVWWVFAPSGRLLGEVTTPTSLTIHDFREGLVAAVDTGPDGQETVVVARVRDDLWGTSEGRPDCQ